METSESYRTSTSHQYQNPGPLNYEDKKYLDPESALLVASMISNPPYNVGPVSCGVLDSNSSNQDTATMPGTKSQKYTTWNCMCRSYIVAASWYLDPQQKIDQQDEVDKLIKRLIQDNYDSGNRIANTIDQIGVAVGQFADTNPKINVAALLTALENRMCFAWYKGTPSTNSHPTLASAKEISTGIVGGSIGWNADDRKWYTPKMLANVLRGKRYTSDDFIDNDDDATSSISDCSILSDLQSACSLSEATFEMSDDKDSQTATWSKECYYIYSDILPVRYVQSRKQRRAEELARDLPFTPAYQSIVSRLNDMTASSAMMSIVRSPTVRDGSIQFNLAKFTMNNSDCYKDVGVLVRCLCIGLSIGKFAWHVDNTKYRFIRRGQGWTEPIIHIVTAVDIPTMPQRPETNIIAMPVDLAISFAMNKLQTSPPQGYRYDDLDTNLIMIPIRMQLLHNQYASVYIASFLTSELWNGTVNWRTTGQYTGRDGNVTRHATLTHMPEINSTYIPGPKKAILVLLDCTATSHPPTISLNQLVIQVWDGSNANIEGSNFTDHWTTEYWNNNHLDRLRPACAGAWNELCRYNAVEDTCGLALSVAAELYNHNFAGMHIAPAQLGHGYNYGVIGGAWALGGGFVEGQGGKYVCQNTNFGQMANNNDTNTTQVWRQKLTGFNFSALSPLHRVPTALVRLIQNQSMAINDRNENYINFGYAAWSTLTPEKYRVGYEVQEASSIMRLVTAMGLLATHHQNYSFNTFSGLETWMSMLSSALAMTTVNALVMNAIPLRTWTGWSDFMSFTNEFNAVHKYINDMTQSIAVVIQVHDLLNMTNEWDWTNAVDYYNMNPTNDPDFWSHSPWPFHSACQWADKMKYSSFNTVPKFTSETFIVPNNRNEPIMGIDMRDEDKFWKLYLVGTIDFTNYAPRIYVIEQGYNQRFARPWFEQWAYISNADFRHATADPEYMETNCWLVPKNTYPAFSTYSNIIFVTGTRAQQNIHPDQMLKVWPLRYPDPPTLGDFLRAARDYIVIPAASGLATYLASGGNPVAAGAAAIGSAVTAASKDIAKREIHEAKARPVELIPQEQPQPPQKKKPEEEMGQNTNIVPAGIPGNE